MRSSGREEKSSRSVCRSIDIQRDKQRNEEEEERRRVTRMGYGDDEAGAGNQQHG